MNSLLWGGLAILIIILIILCIKYWEKLLIFFENKIKEHMFYTGVVSPFIGIMLNPIWFFLIVALIIWSCSGYFSYFGEEYIGVAQSIALAVVSGGVWVAITKSQYMRTVFIEEIRNVMYSKEHLSKRSDVSEIWSNVTQSMYKAKFPEIHEAITDRISADYLPKDHDHYIEDFIYEIDIIWADPNDPNCNYIVIAENESSKIKQNDKNHPFSISFSTAIDIDNVEEDSSEIKTSYTFESLFINGVSQDTVKGLSNELSNELKSEYRHIRFKHPDKIIGSKDYEITKKEKKVYSINSNPYKSFTAIPFIKKLEVKVDYPKDMKIEFLEIGTKRFKDVTYNENSNYNTIRKRSREIILTNQGFCLIMQRI